MTTTTPAHKHTKTPPIWEPNNYTSITKITCTQCSVCIHDAYMHTCIHALTYYTHDQNPKKNKKKLPAKKEYNTRDSNVVPHRSTNRARTCLTSLSRREAVLSSWYGRIHQLVSIFRYIYCGLLAQL